MRTRVTECKIRGEKIILFLVSPASHWSHCCVLIRNVKSAPFYVLTPWLELVPDSQCQGYRDLSTNISPQTWTLLYQPRIPRSGPTALPQLSQKRPSKMHLHVDPHSACEGFQLCCQQSGSMELTATDTTAGWEILLHYRICIFTGAQKDHHHLCSGGTAGFVRSHTTSLDMAKTVSSAHPAVILLPCWDPELSIQAKPICQQSDSPCP